MRNIDATLPKGPAMNDEELRAVMSYAGLEAASDEDFRRLKIQFQISLSGREVLDQLDLHEITPITTGPLYPSNRHEDDEA